MKRTAAALTALLLAAGAYLGFSQQQAPPTAPPDEPTVVIHQVIAEPVETFDLMEEADEDDDDSRRSWKSRIRAAWTNGGRMLFQLLVTGPLSLLGHAVSALLTAAGSVLLAAVKFILLEVLTTFLALLIPLCLLFKALFPDKSLREFLTKKNLLRILIAAIVVSALTRIAEVAWPQVKGLKVAVKALLLLLAMVWLWHKTFSLKGRFLGRLRRFFWCPRGLALLAVTALGCCVTIWVETGPLRGKPVHSGIFGSGMTYLLCAAVAFTIYRRQLLLRRRIKKQKQAGEAA